VGLGEDDGGSLGCGALEAEVREGEEDWCVVGWEVLFGG